MKKNKIYLKSESKINNIAVYLCQTSINVVVVVVITG